MYHFPEIKGDFYTLFQSQRQKAYPVSGQRVRLQSAISQCPLSYTQELNYQSSEERGLGGLKLKLLIIFTE